MGRSRCAGEMRSDKLCERRREGVVFQAPGMPACHMLPAYVSRGGQARRVHAARELINPIWRNVSTSTASAKASLGI